MEKEPYENKQYRGRVSASPEITEEVVVVAKKIKDTPKSKENELTSYEVTKEFCGIEVGEIIERKYNSTIKYMIEEGYLKEV